MRMRLTPYRKRFRVTNAFVGLDIIDKRVTNPIKIILHDFYFLKNRFLL